MTDSLTEAVEVGANCGLAVFLRVRPETRRQYARAVIEAAVASGALVPADARDASRRKDAEWYAVLRRAGMGDPERIQSLIERAERAERERDEARAALPSLISFALAPPTNAASEAARDAAVARARALLDKEYQ